MYIGIDLGTSGIKIILIDEQQQILATHNESLTVSRPHPLWSEQSAEEWWQATERAMLALAQQHSLTAVKAIGLSGQMHGATLLDKQDQPLRPAILWNDGRSAEQCRSLEQRVPNSRTLTGNLMMPGFTAPKLQWVQEHEPSLFQRIHKILLPKDYLRFRLCGEYASDLSDSAGTLWLNVAQRDWSDELLTACNLSREQMPTLYEGNQITGYLRPQLAQRWGMASVPIVAGGGDNAAGAVGSGVINPNQAMLSLGTSGVYFAVSDGYLSAPEQAVHSFCHALPQRWHLMSVILSAASCLDWVCQLTGAESVGALLKEVGNRSTTAPSPYFLPYLSGERTPHNNPNATGVFWGLTHQHQRADLAHAVLEGVSFALADGIDAVDKLGTKADTVYLIGGGARSTYWRQLLADISGKAMEYRIGSEVSPALGAARLAMLAVTSSSAEELCLPCPLEQVHQPNKNDYTRYQERRSIFNKLYQQLVPLW